MASLRRCVVVIALAAAVPVIAGGQAAGADTRPLTPRGLGNVAAFATLLGYVRHFHPSDQAARADWHAFAVDGVRAVEGAATVDALRQQLDRLFRSVAPSVSVFTVSGRPALPPSPPAPGNGQRLLAWRHLGFGGGEEKGPFRSERVAITGVPEVLDVALGAGVGARVPLAVVADADGTLPRASGFTPARAAAAAPARVTAHDRSTRLAAVSIAWNVLQHFYPYFDVVRTDWPAILPLALEQAAIDRDELALTDTLNRMVAGLRDGHARAEGPAAVAGQANPPVTFEWTEGRLVVERAADSTGLGSGDAVVSIDGTPVPFALEDHERAISGATAQWLRLRAQREFLRGPAGSRVTLRVERTGGPARLDTVVLTRQRAAFEPSPRLAALAEPRPGVMYVDVTRVTDAEVTAALASLASAQAIVVDLRGSAATTDPGVLFRHLSRTDMSGPPSLLPLITRPDRQNVTFADGPGQTIPHAPPSLGARQVFLIDARTIGRAESYALIADRYRLGDTIGGPTAGTIGAVNRVPLPGGLALFFTGTRTLRHDGSQHHGIGVRPTIPVTRTRAGVAAGKDEILDRALDALTGP